MYCGSRSKTKEKKVYYLLISDQNLLIISHLVVGQAAFLILAVTKMFTKKLSDQDPLCWGENTTMRESRIDTLQGFFSLLREDI